MRKLTYEEVKNSIENTGYTLLSEEYINAHTKLRVKCDQGHEFEIIWSNWKKGVRCSYCFGNPKYDYEEVKKSFEDEGYALLTKKYSGNKQLLEFICPNGSKNKITYKKWNKGIRCNCWYCGRNRGAYIYNYEDAKYLFKQEGYTLLTSKEEFDKKSPKPILDFICNRGHKHSMLFDNFRRGHRCQKCQYENYRTFDEENEEDWKIYSWKCRKESNQNYRRYKNYINPNNLPRGKHKYHLDHIFTISEGFRNNIPVHIISSVHNLQFLYYSENMRKERRSEISKEELFERYFEEK